MERAMIPAGAQEDTIENGPGTRRYRTKVVLGLGHEYSGNE